MTRDEIGVLVVAGYDLLAWWVQSILSEAGMRVAVARSLEDAAVTLGETQPRVLVLDGYSLSNGDGLALVERLRALAPFSRVILLACHYDYLQVAAALRHGVDGYLYLGDRLAAQLPEVVGDVLAGAAYISPTAVKMFATQQFERSAVERRLSDYQREVLRLMLAQQDTSQIAASLGRTTTAIYQVQKHLREVFGARSNPDLLSRAGALGFVMRD